MAETLKVGLKLKIFASSLMLANFLSKLLHPGVQKKRKKLGGRSAPTPWALKGQKYAGSIVFLFCSQCQMHHHNHLRVILFIIIIITDIALMTSLHCERLDVKAKLNNPSTFVQLLQNSNNVLWVAHCNGKVRMWWRASFYHCFSQLTWIWMSKVASGLGNKTTKPNLANRAFWTKPSKQNPPNQTKFTS